MHDDRGFKHRGEAEAREVPIPPELVAILRTHIDRFGVDADGRCPQRAGQRGGVLDVLPSVGGGAAIQPATGAGGFFPGWSAVRPAARRVSLWLNAGLPAPEAAERAGHSVYVLLKVYAKCLDGDRSRMNERIKKALN
ncbi:hypothetical protein ACIBO1_02880 [Micromonospora sp. NPDC049903]|uniref:hypothetical protein n=1 Tax=Micromonospora sp. NPDC049903 TaxID=3364276 RepID=UPI0037B2C7A1